MRFALSTPDRRRAVSVRPMKKTDKPSDSSDDLHPEYDFSGGVRGKYAQRFREGTNIVVLDPDVAAEFKDSQALKLTGPAFRGGGRLCASPPIPQGGAFAPAGPCPAAYARSIRLHSWR